MGGALHVRGGHGQRPFVELRVGSGGLREHEHASAGVDDGAFLGNQIHAVYNGVNQENVVELHCSHSLGVVVLVEDGYGLPVIRAKGFVYLGDQAVHLLKVSLVLPYVGTRRDEECEELHLSSEVRVALQQEAVGPEPPYDVLARLHAVHSNDGLLSKQKPELFLVL